MEYYFIVFAIINFSGHGNRLTTEGCEIHVSTVPYACGMYGEPTVLHCSYDTSSCSNFYLEWCKYVGSLCETIVQIKDGKDLIFPGYEGFSLIGLSDLNISSINHDDAATYRCAVRDGSTTDESTLYLDVQYGNHTSELRISFDIVHEDKMVNMTCHTSDPDPATYAWKKNGTIINVDDPDVDIDSESPYLVITSTSMNDTGNYSCLVHTCAGNAESLSTFLNVTSKVRLPEKLDYESTHNIVYREDAVIFTMHAVGNPSPNFTWRNVNGYIEGQHEHELTVNADDSYEEVYCSSCNPFGCKDDSIKINVNYFTYVGFITFVVVLSIIAVALAVAGILVAYYFIKRHTKKKGPKEES